MLYTTSQISNATRLPPSQPPYLPEDYRAIDPTYRLNKSLTDHPILPYKDESGQMHDPFYYPFPLLGAAKAKKVPRERPLYFETVKLPEQEPLPDVYEQWPLKGRRKGAPRQFPRSAYGGELTPTSPTSPSKASRRELDQGSSSEPREVSTLEASRPGDKQSPKAKSESTPKGKTKCRSHSGESCKGASKISSS